MSEDKRFVHLKAKNIRENLQADCTKCFGLCCTALNVAASSDFAMNKGAGEPCLNLQPDYRCKIHSNLREKGFKGCTVFDCLGAGQRVSQDTFKGQDWREYPLVREKMFRVFPIMDQLYEMIAYIGEAMSYQISPSLFEKLKVQLDQLQSLTMLDPDQLLSIDIPSYRHPVNELLVETSEYIRNNIKVTTSNKSRNYKGVDWIGKKLKGQDLRGINLRGAYLIASDLRNTDLRGADFIGADLRDADLSGANLSTSLFLTQMQINSAKGNKETKLPYYLQRPPHWTE